MATTRYAGAEAMHTHYHYRGPVDGGAARGTAYDERHHRREERPIRMDQVYRAQQLLARDNWLAAVVDVMRTALLRHGIVRTALAPVSPPCASRTDAHRRRRSDRPPLLLRCSSATAPPDVLSPGGDDR